MSKQRPIHEGTTPPSPSWPGTFTIPELAFEIGLGVDHPRWVKVGHALHEITEAAGMRRHRISYAWKPRRLGRRVLWSLRCWDNSLRDTAIHLLTCHHTELPYPEAWAQADREEAERKERKRAARKRQRAARRARDAAQTPTPTVIVTRRRAPSSTQDAHV